MEGISIMKLLVVVALVVLLFGTNKLRRLGSDLGEAIKGFKKSMADDDANANKTDPNNDPSINITKPTDQADATFSQSAEKSDKPVDEQHKDRQ